MSIPKVKITVLKNLLIFGEKYLPQSVNLLGAGGPGMQGAGLHLAKEVLAEIPEQFLSFMKTNKIVPKTTSKSTGQSSALPPDPEAAINVNF